MPHFLSPFDDRMLTLKKSEGPRQIFQAGYLSIEISGHLLNHRPASRPGDDIIIWSLLMSEKSIFQDAESFWSAMQGPILQISEINGRIVNIGATIHTGYLISSAPRLKIKGLRWAPISPTFRFSQRVPNGLSGFDCGKSGPGHITIDGLVTD